MIPNFKIWILRLLKSEGVTGIINMCTSTRDYRDHDFCIIITWTDVQDNIFKPCLEHK